MLGMWRALAGAMEGWPGPPGAAVPNEYLHVCQADGCTAEVRKRKTSASKRCGSGHPTVAAPLIAPGQPTPAIAGVYVYVYYCQQCNRPRWRGPEAPAEHPACPEHRTQLTLLARPRGG